MRRSWRCGPGPFGAALEEFRRLGGMVEGSESEGSLRATTPLGRIEGQYSFDGEMLTITITQRPALLSAEMVWSRLDSICGSPIASV
jgi:hypothetical protein